jgi:glycerol-3-phosphate dehydrogenase (NAD(P)+)
MQMSNAGLQDRDTEIVAVVGAGAWGTALARMLAMSGTPTTLVTHTEAQATALNTLRENQRYLPGFRLPETLDISHEIEQSVPSATVIFIVVPSTNMRSVSGSLQSHLRKDAIVVSCAKGFENISLMRMTEVVADAALVPTDRLCALSGPNLAREIAADLPASTVVASQSSEAAMRVQRALSSSSFRVYSSLDVIGVEYGGALKNVVALGAGAVDGMGGGQNAKAALMTRGLAEMIRLGVAAGAHPMTFGGLSGLGDLIATCESPLSRNRTFGERLGRGIVVKDAAGDSPHVVEGIAATRAAVELANRFDVEMPIARAIYDVLEGTSDVRDAVIRLMARETRAETDMDVSD